MYNDSLKYKLSDSDLLRAFKKRQFEKWDYENTIETAMKEGEQRGKLIGMKEGELKGKLDAARDLLAAGFSAAQIAEILKLPLEDIKKLEPGN